MKPEEIAVRLNELGYEPLLNTIKAVDPDLFEVIKALTVVRNNGYGTVSLEVYNGKITLVTHTFKKHLH